jgi:WD40 repeat protein
MDSVDAVAVTPDGQQVVTTGHKVALGRVAGRPDDRPAVVWNETRMLRVWDIETGACQLTLEGHEDLISALALVPDGRHAVTGSWDETVKVWDLRKGICLQTLKHPGKVCAVTVTPDGRRIVTWTGEAEGPNEVIVWDLATGACLRTLECDAGLLGLTPDGYQALTWGSDQYVRTWDLRTGECLKTLGQMKWVGAAAFTPDGKKAVIGGDAHTLKVWCLETASEVACFVADDSVSACVVSPDGARILAGGDKGGVYFLALEDAAASPPVVTVWRDAQEALAFGCPFCRTWSEIQAFALGAESPCPKCGETVRLNAFTIDADWRPVAAAWRRGKH